MDSSRFFKRGKLNIFKAISLMQELRELILIVSLNSTFND